MDVFKFLWTILFSSITVNSVVTSINIIYFIDHPDYVVIPKDDFAKIKCQINAPNAKYSWLLVDEKTNTEHPVIQNQYISFDKDDVLILKHSPATAGKYRCRAIVPRIGVVISSIIEVELADIFINKLSVANLGKGHYKLRDRAVLICPFSAIPQTEVAYKWVLKTPEGRTPIYSSKTSVFHQKGRQLELEINKSSFGSYLCTAAYSKYGLERRSPEIDVLPSPESEHVLVETLKWISTPLESLFLDNQKLYHKYVKTTNGQRTLINKEHTSRLELLCAANTNGDGLVEIIWFKDKVRIDRAAIQYARFNYEITGQGTLILINTTRVYNGLYTCQASLRDNSSVILSQSFNLVIKPHLRFINKPPPIVIEDKNEEILLSCRINDVDFQNKIVWRKNGELIFGNNYFQQNEGFLRISKFLESDEGIFQCLADNEFSSIEATTQLKIRKRRTSFPDHRPLPVKGLRVKAFSFKTLNISWNPAVPGFETILHYEIILFDLSNLSRGNHKITLKSDRLESSILVKNLVPDSFYKIYVYSVNGSGKSYPAVINSPRVLSRAPSAAPTNVRVSNIGSSVASISWSAPVASQMNGELIGYRVVVISTDPISSKNEDVELTEKLQLSDLAPDTNYSVQIQASTRGGRGPLSTYVSFVTKIAANDHDETFKRMHRQGLNIKRKTFFASGTEESKKDDKNAELPSQIVSWLAKSLNTSISLQWSHPVQGGPTIKYMIKWGKVYPGPAYVTVAYPTNAYVIDNLEYRTQYMIKIIPINDLGDGKELLFSATTGSPDIRKIPIPLNLGVIKVGMTWVILSWEDPSSDLSSTRLYQIRFSSLDKDYHFTEMKNSTETRAQIIGLRASTWYSFSVRTGDVAPQRDGDYGGKEWVWSEWSLKESFNTMGEKPTSSPQDFKLATIGNPDVRNNDAYTRVEVSWSSPHRNNSKRNDEITRYTIYFTSEPRTDFSNWHTQILPSDQYSSEINLNGFQRVYFVRVGCQTKNFECPLSPILLYKTTDSQKQNYGLLRVPDKFRYSVDIPMQYLNANPVHSIDGFTEEPLRINRDTWWIMMGCGFGFVVFLIVLIILIFIWYRKRTQSSFTGYKLGTKSSIQHIGGAGLLLSNQSPALSNGKVSPHFVGNFNQSLKTPDLFPHPEPHFVDLESDSNQDNDSLRFASVSQHHLASTSGVTNLFNPTIQNHSLIRSHPQMVSYYSDMPSHSKSALNASTILNPLINNSISIPIQIQDTSLQRVQHQNPVYSYQGHPFTQHLLSTGVGMPICSSSCLQPIHLSPQMLANPAHEVHSPANFSNTPRVNASELASHTSSEEIGPVILNGSRATHDIIGGSGGVGGGGDFVSQYYGGVSSTGKPHKPGASSKPPAHVESMRNSDAIKTGLDSSQSELEVTKGFSTEELSQEMANLEGLMKDLNAITQKEFEC